MAETYSMVIMGAGAAGFTAGLYAARDRCQALVIERMAPGGRFCIVSISRITPGCLTESPVTPWALCCNSRRCNWESRCSLPRSRRCEVKVLQTGSGALRTRALIIATGSSFPTLGVPGEEAFLGRGMSHCAPCDGARFMGQPVAVIGGGDAVLEEGL